MLIGLPGRVGGAVTETLRDGGPVEFDHAGPVRLRSRSDASFPSLARRFCQRNHGLADGSEGLNLAGLGAPAVPVDVTPAQPERLAAPGTCESEEGECVVV